MMWSNFLRSREVDEHTRCLASAASPRPGNSEREVNTQSSVALLLVRDLEV